MERSCSRTPWPLPLGLMEARGAGDPLPLATVSVGRGGRGTPDPLLAGWVLSTTAAGLEETPMSKALTLSGKVFKGLPLATALTPRRGLGLDISPGLCLTPGDIGDPGVGEPRCLTEMDRGRLATLEDTRLIVSRFSNGLYFALFCLNLSVGVPRAFEGSLLEGEDALPSFWKFPFESIFATLNRAAKALRDFADTCGVGDGAGLLGGATLLESEADFGEGFEGDIVEVGEGLENDLVGCFGLEVDDSLRGVGGLEDGEGDEGLGETDNLEDGEGDESLERSDKLED